MTGPGMVKFDARELREFGMELPKLGVAGAKAMHKVLSVGAVDLRDEWRKNAEVTSGEHGRLYPKSIVVFPWLSTDVVYDIGPDPRLPQGGMSFEFGSSKQPPHLDGQRAADEVIPKIAGRATTVLFHLFEGQ